MKDDNNRKNLTEPFDDGMADGLQDALTQADDVIEQALRRKELEDAIAETDREVAELAAKRKKAGQSAVPVRQDDSVSGDDPEPKDSPAAGRSKEPAAGHTDRPQEDHLENTPADSEAPASADPDRSGTDTPPAAGSAGKGSPAAGSSKKSRGKRSGHTGRKILTALLVLLVLVVSVRLIQKYTPTSKRMSYTEYFGEMAPNEAAIVLQDHNIEDRALVSGNGSLYIPYQLVRSSLNERFYWDDTLNKILFTTPLQTYEIPINATSYSVIDGALTSDPTSEGSYKEIILLRDDASSNLYLSLDFVTEYTNVTYSYEKETQHVYLRNQWGDTLTAAAVKDAAVRYQGGIKSPILTNLNKGDRVMVLEETEHWMKVLTLDGFIGYVKSNRMAQPSDVNIINEGFTEQEYTSAAPEERVSVVWHMISSAAGNKNFENDTSAMSGVTAISPTWFSLADNDGNVDSIGSAAYSRKAHAKNLQVWGLVSDFSADMDTSVMLASTSARRRCIGQLIDYAKELDLDGINLDFEYVEEPDALCFTQFVRELSIACRRDGLILSVDLVPPYDFNAYYNRAEIAAVSDYLITMGYDEHYAGSEAAGSVASLPYEENAIRSLLEMGIPAKKLISAIPFYTRIWYTSTDGDGITHVNSEELSMGSVSATLDSWHLTPSWDAESAQNYVGWYTDDGVLCEIWIEDEQSLQRKALLTSKYDLGGTAIWALGFERSSIWNIVSESAGLSPEDAGALEDQLIEEAAASALEDTGSDGASAQTETEAG